MIQRVAYRIKQLGWFYLVFGAGFLIGCIYIGFLAGIGGLG
jgi:predicted MFS family arabinose efflux permease